MASVAAGSSFESKRAGASGWLCAPVSALPLALFRVAFGVLMFVSTLRFLLNGWVHDFYVTPTFHFTYLGFGWVKPLPEVGMYALFGLMLLATLLVALGLFYRVGIVSFFLLFTYVELLDKTFYLNHYYFVSLLSFLLIFLPLNARASLDVRLGIRSFLDTVPSWTLYAIRLQLVIVYFFAGVAKLNPDWLFAAQPLRIWLRANTELPLIGGLFDYLWVAFVMSWAGLLYDLTIPFFLLRRRTRPFAYLVVIAFHVLTALLFPIGMFSWIMLVSTLIFFSVEGYRTALRWLRLPKRVISKVNCFPRAPLLPRNSRLFSRLAPVVLSLFFVFQVGMCLRHLAYPGSVLWHEQGYRFSWRVMLAEKTGNATFRVISDGKTRTVYPSEVLTPQQVKQMNFQPDMILQFAHFLARQEGDAQVYADVWVSVNGRPSERLIDPDADLAAAPYNLAARPWTTSDLALSQNP